MSDSAIRYVVTTVHGTYAKHATWVGGPKSKLEQALTKRFGASVWQRYGERLQPELELRKRFLRLLNRWSGHPFWLLAASVGGFVFFLVLIFGAAALKMLEGVSLGVAVAFLWLCVVVPALTLIGGIIDEAWPIEAAAFPFQFVVGGSLFATIIVLSLTLLPFGWQTALSNIFYDITAETTPPGPWEVNLIEPSRSQDQTGDVPPLEHSVVYEDKGALTRICDWIERTEKRSHADG